MSHFQDEAFVGVNFVEAPLTKGDYDGCTFENCIFSEADLREVVFEDCEFVDCDLSLAKLVKTAFREVAFKNCKMLGLRFDSCDPFNFQVRFESCTLNMSSFYGMRLSSTVFDDCKLKEVDFVEADLSDVQLKHCNLTGASFDRTNLERADLSTSKDFDIDPEINKVKGAIFSENNLIGLLKKHNIKISG